jgi:hypothetical protein
MLNFSTKYLFHTCRVLKHAVKSYDMGPTALLPPEGRHAADFVALKNPSPTVGFEPANVESNCKLANH